MGLLVSNRKSLDGAGVRSRELTNRAQQAAKANVVMHITNGLGNGGAEGVLARLCVNDSVNLHSVICLTGSGKYAEILRTSGIDVQVLNIQGIWSTFFGFFRVLTLAMRRHPNIIQSWMPHSDLIASLVRPFVPSSELVWSIRHGSYEKGSSKLTTRAVVRLLAMISSIAPARIISCSEQGMKAHILMGYQPKKFSVIANGTDLDVFSPMGIDADERKPPTKRAETSFAMLGRFHPQKDHNTLLRAFQILQRDGIKFTAEIAGIEPHSARLTLRESCEDLDLSASVSIRGEVDNPAKFYLDKDYLVSSSNSGEGFPNVIAEAMACGIPVISTDVGDSKLIIGDAGWVVPPRDHFLLADALGEACQVSQAERALLSNAARNRIRDYFSLEKMIHGYQSLYDSLRR